MPGTRWYGILWKRNSVSIGEVGKIRGNQRVRMSSSCRVLGEFSNGSLITITRFGDNHLFHLTTLILCLNGRNIQIPNRSTIIVKYTGAIASDQLLHQLWHIQPSHPTVLTAADQIPSRMRLQELPIAELYMGDRRLVEVEGPDD